MWTQETMISTSIQPNHFQKARQVPFGPAIGSGKMNDVETDYISILPDFVSDDQMGLRPLLLLHMKGLFDEEERY